MASRPDFYAIYNRTRVRAPSLGAEVISRPRLMRALELAAGTKLTLIQAPAGYGKTCLLQQWREHLVANAATVAWFTADHADQDPNAFFSYVVHALEEAGHPVDARIRNILRNESYWSWEGLAIELANSFIGVHAPIYIIIDDAQYLKNSPALECLRFLLENTPAEAHFVIASREDLGIPLGRPRALGQVYELHASDLQFITSEATSYLSKAGHTDLSEQQIALLEARTEGWIVGLKLLSMALHWDPQLALDMQTLSGERRQIADFFAEDVLRRQPRQLQEFLLRTSVLDRFCPALCDAVTESTSSRELLDQCDADGLFLISLDQTRTWYRYHQLFAEYLRRQLNDRLPGLANELYLRASRWLDEFGFHVEAFDYALRGNNPIRAAEILDARCDAMWSAGKQDALQRLAARLPAHVQALYPRIMLAISWRLIAQWNIRQAEQLVAVCSARLEDMQRSQAPAEALRTLRFRILHRQAQISHYFYQLETMEKQCRELLFDFTDVDDPYLKGSTYITLQYVQREQYQLDEIHKLSKLGHDEMQRTGFTHGLVFHAALCGPSYFLAGKTDEAISLLSKGLELARSFSWPTAPLGAVVAMHLSQVHYECNDVERASDLMEDYFAASCQAGLVDQLVSGWITRFRLVRMRGDSTSALQILDEAIQFADQHEIPRLKLVANAEYIRALLRMGKPDDANRVARRNGLPRILDITGPNRRLTTCDAALALAWCKLAAAQDRAGEALAIARRWRAHVTTARAVHAAVEWNIMVAELLLLCGDAKAAQRALWQAITQAAPARFVRSFIDEGEPMAALLNQILTNTPEMSPPLEAFLRELLACFDQRLIEHTAASKSKEFDTTVSGRMNTRELEILALAGAGMLNKQISEKLGLTEGTVKWYLQQVFDKLGVRDRSRAAAKARRLGLITEPEATVRYR